MSEHTAIEWTDATWNPVTGCTKVSPGCASCYIERTPPFRMKGRRFVKGHIPLELHADRLETPLRWRKPRRIFVNSLSDLFHHDVRDTFIDQVFAVMALCPQHTFQVLTKRAERMRDYMTTAGTAQRVLVAMKERRHSEGRSGFGLPLAWPLSNVWLGVSVENQHFADERIWHLLRTPAAVRFISVEPMLSAIDLERVGHDEDCGGALNALTGEFWIENWHDAMGAQRSRQGLEVGDRLDWVIVGGESGPRFRYTRHEWVQAVRDQCVAAGVPFLFKQWGGPTPKSHGRLLDGRPWDEYPEARR